MTKYVVIKNWIENIASDKDLVSIVNGVNSYNGSLDSMYYYRMEDMNELFYEVKPLELLDKLAKDFDSTQELFKDTIYGLESCSYTEAGEDIKSYADDVAEAIINVMEEYELWIPASLEFELEESKEEKE